jgi:hypothetical protein
MQTKIDNSNRSRTHYRYSVTLSLYGERVSYLLPQRHGCSLITNNWNGLSYLKVMSSEYSSHNKAEKQIEKKELTCEWDPTHSCRCETFLSKGGHIFENHTVFHIIKIAITRSVYFVWCADVNHYPLLSFWKKTKQEQSHHNGTPLLSASLLLLHPELKQSFLFVTIKLSLGFDLSIVSCQLSMSWTA